MASCEFCGREVKPRGFAAHSRGARCASATEARCLREQGFTRVGRFAAIEAAGYEVRSALTGFSPGGRGRRSKRTLQQWAPAEPVGIVNTFGASLDNGLLVLLLRATEEQRVAAAAVLALGGRAAVAEFVRRELGA